MAASERDPVCAGARLSPAAAGPDTTGGRDVFQRASTVGIAAAGDSRAPGVASESDWTAGRTGSNGTADADMLQPVEPAQDIRRALGEAEHQHQAG
jgi:hypothetical protein